jgi:hypothetical protein
LIDLAPEERLVGMARAEREEGKDGEDQDRLEDIPEEINGDDTDDTI